MTRPAPAGPDVAAAPASASTSASGANPSRVAARLARLSFVDGARAAELLSDAPLAWWDLAANAPSSDAGAAVVAALGRSADPDAALAALAEMLGQPGGAGLREALETRADLRARLFAVLAVSVELAGHLRDHSEDWRVLADDLDPAGVARRVADSVGADAADPATGTAGTRAKITGWDAVRALRRAYRREVVAVAGRDLAGDLDLRTVTEQLAELADAVLRAALAVAAAGLPADAVPCRLAVIAMGKTGSCELNYASDVDVVFVAEPTGATDDDPDAALVTATRLAGELMQICRDVAWPVDANLRPEGRDGALVRTLRSHLAYYQRWASTWEFQALLKARPAAGDLALGAAYVDEIAPLVWSAAERPDFVADVRAMRRRVVDHIPGPLVERDIKLGRGGLRDVEFAVQLLQLVHGRADETLHVAGTLAALDALRNGGYVGRDDAVSLIDAYRFLRATENRLQLHRLRRSHVVPDDPAALEWLGRAMGYKPDHRGDARAVFEAEWRLHAREVRRLHEKLFYRPLLEAVARVPSVDLRLTPDQAVRRLGALGYADPGAALRHIEALTAGLSRRAALQRTLLPVLLADFADAPDPDAGLLAYRRLSDELGTTPWYLRLLRDGDAVVSRLAYVLGTSRYATRMLGRAPEALRMLASPDQLAPRSHAQVLAAMREVAGRQHAPGPAVTSVRAVRRQELLRAAFADLLETGGLDQTCASLSDTSEASLQAAFEVAERAVLERRGLTESPVPFAIVAMGRLGGREVGYASDADVMFVHGDAERDQTLASDVARDIAGEIRALLGSPSSTDPPLTVDAGLRPEGRNGPLVRSLSAYRRYYAQWSSPWEAQALLRARPVAGDEPLGQQFVRMIDPVRYPPGGVTAADLLEIRRIKGRVDSERLPRGADPTTHTKLGRGGLTDIEWTVQLLQLRYGHAVPALRTTGTLPALAAADAAGLLDADQAALLEAAWRFATRVRNALMLVRDKPGDQLPALGAELVSVARVLGYPLGSDPGQLVDDYRRAARRARKVVESVFYDS